MIEVELMPILFDEARSAALGVGADCEREVREFMMPHDQLYRSSAPIERRKIKWNFRRFVVAMVDEALEMNLSELRETTFHAARTKICPLFPFC